MTPVLNTASKLIVGSQTVTRAYLGSTKVWESWTPKSISGLTVWLDASQLALADGAAVSPWPNLADATKPGTMVGTPTPKMSTNKLNGQSLVRFTVSEGRLRITNTGVRLDYTVAYVGRALSASQGRVLTTDYPGEQNNNWLVGFHTVGYDWFYDNGNVSSAKGWDANGFLWKLYSADSTGSDPMEQRIFADGVQLGDRVSGGGLGMGSRLNISGYANTEETCDCEIAEVVLYNRKLSDSDRQTVEGYLRKKWLT